MVTVPVGAKKLTQHAITHSFWAILPALGECFHAIAIDSRHWANFVAPMLLTAPRDVTVGTNAGASGRLYETHDAFARQNSAENRCIWLAMATSVSPEAKHTPAKVMTVSRELPAAVPVGSGGLAGLRANAPSNTSATRRHWCEGRKRAWPRCPWAAAGPGRGAGGWRQGQGGPRDRPLRAAGSRVAISRAGRRPPAHTAARPHKQRKNAARHSNCAA